MTCDKCGESGIVSLFAHGAVRIYRCRCPFGVKHPEFIFGPSDKEKKYPIKVPFEPLDGTKEKVTKGDWDY